MRVSRLAWVAFVAGCLGGETGRPLGERCAGDGSCREGLVCRLGRCRSPCSFDRDCPAGAACVPTGEGRACTLADEAGCGGSAGCPEGLVCLEAEGLCREPCGDGLCDGDGWDCVLGVCRPRCPDEGCGEGRVCAGGLCFEPGCDADSDGHASVVCGGEDCDDSEPAVHPGAAELCGDEVDRNCDGVSGGGRLEPLGPAVPLVERVASPHPPSIACAPSTCALAWSWESPGELGIDVVVVGPSGEVVRRVSSPAGGAPARLGRHGVVWSGSEFLAVATREGPDQVFSRRLGPRGEAAGAEWTFLSDGARDPAIAWSGTSFGLAWLAGPAGAADLRFLAFPPEVTPGEGASTPVARDLGAPSGLSVSWHGAGWGLAWSEEPPADALRCAALDRGGDSVQVRTLLDGTAGVAEPALACGDGRCGLVATVGEGPFSLLLGAFDGATGEPDWRWLEPVFALAPAPAIARVGTGYAVVSTGAGTGGRLGIEGERETLDQVAIDAGGSAFGSPAVAAAEGFLGVAWLDSTAGEIFFLALSLCDP